MCFCLYKMTGIGNLARHLANLARLHNSLSFVNSRPFSVVPEVLRSELVEVVIAAFPNLKGESGGPPSVFISVIVAESWSSKSNGSSLVLMKTLFISWSFPTRMVAGSSDAFSQIFSSSALPLASSKRSSKVFEACKDWVGDEVVPPFVLLLR